MSWEEVKVSGPRMTTTLLELFDLCRHHLHSGSRLTRPSLSLLRRPRFPNVTYPSDSMFL